MPLVFGARWSFAAPYIATMCLAGIPLVLSQLTASWLRAEGRVGTDAWSSAVTCALALGGLTLGAQTGHIGIAIAGLVMGQCLAGAWFSLRVLIPALDLTPATLTHGEPLA